MQNQNNKYTKLMQKLYQKQLSFDSSRDNFSEILTQQKDTLEDNSLYQKQLFDLKEQISYLQQNELKNNETLNNDMKVLTSKHQSLLKSHKSQEVNFKELEYLVNYLKNNGSPTSIVKKILLLDEPSVNRAKMNKLFVESGYEIFLAQDIKEAKALLNSIKLDLIIVNIEILDEINLNALLNVKINEKSMPVLLITSKDELNFKKENSNNLIGTYPRTGKDIELLKKISEIFSLIK